MKIRKMLSAFMSMAIVATMLSAFTVAHAADTIKFNISADFNEEKGQVEVKVGYTGFNSAILYDEENVTVNGLRSIQFSIKNDANLAPASQFTTKKYGCLGFGKAANKVGNVQYAYNASDETGFKGYSEGILCVAYYDVSSVDSVKFTVDEIIVRSGAYEDGTFLGKTDYTIDPASVNYTKKVDPPVEEVKAEFDTAAASKFTYGDVYNYGVGGAVTVPAGKSATGVTFDISNGTKTVNYDFDFGTSIAADTSFGLNICRVPVGVELSFSNLQVK